MKLKAIFLCLVVAVLVSSCGTARRATKDAWIGVTGIVLVPMAAGGDAYRASVDVREGYQGESWSQVVAFPFAYIWNFGKHLLYWAVHVVDLPLNILYGISEVSSYGPEIEPIDYYQNTWVDAWHERATKKKSGTDAESGESEAGGE